MLFFFPELVSLNVLFDSRSPLLSLSLPFQYIFYPSDLG